MGLTIPDIAALQALPSQALAQIPGEAPPPGAIPNFANPASNVPLILGLSYFFAAVACICFLLRIWTKTFIVKRWQWDDCKSRGYKLLEMNLTSFLVTISLGFVMAIVHLVVVTRGSLYGGTGKHQWEISVDKLINEPALLVS